jgi:hypothetical protein
MLHTVSQTFILNLTPQVNPFLHLLFITFSHYLVLYSSLFFSNLNIWLQIIRYRQRVDDFVSYSSNCRHFCLSLKHRDGTMRILNRHCFFLNFILNCMFVWANTMQHDLTIWVFHIITLQSSVRVSHCM